MSEVILLIPAVLVLCLCRHKHNINIVFLTYFYSLGGIVGYMMTKHELFPLMDNSGRQDVSIIATSYLLLGILLLFYPIASAKPEANYIKPIQKRNLYYFSYFFIFASILYCILCTPYLSLTFAANDINEYKLEFMTEGFDISQGIKAFATITHFQVYLRPFFIFYFFYTLTHINGKNIIKFFLGLSILLPPIFQSLASAHRNVLLYSFADMVISYLMFYTYFSKKARRKLNAIFLSIGVGVLFVMVLFAVLRFDDGSKYVEYSLLRYLGEPFVDFNTMLWEPNFYLDGNKSFSYIKGLLDMNTWSNDIDIRYGFKGNYKVGYFYTVVGTLYMDFGWLITIILLLINCLFFYYLINRLFTEATLSRGLLLFLYTSETFKNYFHFDYQGSRNVVFLWTAFFFLLFHFLITKYKSK